MSQMIRSYRYRGHHRRGGPVHFIARLIDGVLFYVNTPAGAFA